MILAHTIKGYHVGKHFEGRNATHQMKKLTLDDLKAFRDVCSVPIPDAKLEEDPYLPPYYHPGPEAPEIRYMLDRRRALGGFLPERRTKSKPLALPARDTYKALKKGSGNQEVATTMATVRTFKELLRDKNIGPRLVPIIPDEARTFGMDSWFPSLKIYNRHGQLYTSVDAELMLAYRESEAGQILHEGINEAGSTASFTAVGTSYSTHNEPMIPIYIFYSMFGFQRTGDAFWAAADQMARGLRCSPSGWPDTSDTVSGTNIAAHTAQVVDGKLSFGETHIFVGPRYLVTVRHGSSLSYAPVRARCEREPELMAVGPSYGLYAVLDFIVDNFMPIVDEFREQLNALEQDIFAESFRRETVAKLYQLKRDLTRMRLAVAPMQDITGQLITWPDIYGRDGAVLASFAQPRQPKTGQRTIDEKVEAIAAPGA